MSSLRFEVTSSEKILNLKSFWRLEDSESSKDSKIQKIFMILIVLEVLAVQKILPLVLSKAPFIFISRAYGFSIEYTVQ